jgi:hypothetical protein
MKNLENLTVNEIKAELNEAKYLSIAFDLLKDISTPTLESLKEKEELDELIISLEKEIYTNV